MCITITNKQQTKQKKKKGEEQIESMYMSREIETYTHCILPSRTIDGRDRSTVDERDVASFEIASIVLLINGRNGRSSAVHLEYLKDPRAAPTSSV